MVRLGERVKFVGSVDFVFAMVPDATGHAACAVAAAAVVFVIIVNFDCWQSVSIVSCLSFLSGLVLPSSLLTDSLSLKFSTNYFHTTTRLSMFRRYQALRCGLAFLPRDEVSPTILSISKTER